MPNPDALVSSIVRFEPLLDRLPGEMLRAKGGSPVELEGERRVRLDSENPFSASFVQILYRLSKQRLPVYLEIDPETSVITRLLIPHVTRVVSVRPIDEGGLSIEVASSHARHVLRHGQMGFTYMEKQPYEALRNRKLVIITEDDTHNI